MTNLHQSTSAFPAERRHRRSHKHKHSRSTSDTTSVEVPWQQVTHTYTWVMEEEFIKGNKRPIKTEDWVREQQYFFSPKDEHFTMPRPRPSKHRREDFEELVYIFGVEAEDWMRQEERARRLTQEREKARARIQDELRRIEARFQQKRDAERRAREEAQHKAYMEIQEKEKRDRAKLDKLILDAWANYERRWTSMATSSDPVEFRGIPWPLIISPRDTGDITRDAIVALLFSPLHSQNQTRKDRIRSAQLRWHPDRFLRFTGRIADKDKTAVEEGVGIVARCLNELMEKEKKVTSR